MKSPSPFSHLYRLVLVGVAAIGVLLVLGYFLSPTSWHYEIAYWHRADSLPQMQQQPVIYGGIESVGAKTRNAACVSCHENVVASLMKRKHKQLSCESCHGALDDHAQGGEKIADAAIDRSTWQCLNCHADLVNKPKRFPKFRTTPKFIKHNEFISGAFPEGTTCLKCHDSHDPEP